MEKYLDQLVLYEFFWRRTLKDDTNWKITRVESLERSESHWAVVVSSLARSGDRPKGDGAERASWSELDLHEGRLWGNRHKSIPRFLEQLSGRLKVSPPCQSKP